MCKGLLNNNVLGLILTSLNQKYFNASNALMHILTFKDVPCDVQRHFSQLIKTAFHTHTQILCMRKMLCPTRACLTLKWKS